MSDLGGLQRFLSKCEELSCGKVSRNSLELQRTDLRLMRRSYKEADFCLSSEACLKKDGLLGQEITFVFLKVLKWRSNDKQL